MKAYVIEGPRQGGIRELPMPEPGEHEVLIGVRAAGLCGTDAHIYLGEYYSTFPLVPGHEFAGVVAATGSGVKGVCVGQRVAADPNIFCERCSFCRRNEQNFCLEFAGIGVTRDGAFAEYVTAPEACVFPVGDLDFSTAAFIEPLACVVYGQQRARPGIGASVLIFGAGPIGLLHLQLARHGGAAFTAIADIKEERLELARHLGADLALPNDGEAKGKLAKAAPFGFDLVIDTTGMPAVVEAAPAYVRNAGTLLVFGVCPQGAEIRLSPYDIYKRDLRIIGSFALRKTFAPAIDLLAGRRIDVEPLIGGRVLLPDLPDRIEEMAAGEARMKTLVYPHGFPA